jgi:MerR HTH family regulatory protein
MIIGMSPLDPHGAPTFTPKQVCAALEIPHGTLNSWAHSGVLLGFDAELTEPGKARRYSFADLTRLSLMKYFILLGMPVGKSRALSTVCYRYIIESRPVEVRQIQLLMSVDGNFSWTLLNDDTIEKRFPVGSSVPPIPMELIIYPSEILAEVMRRMEAISATSG